MVGVTKIILYGKELGALSWNSEKKYASFEFFPDFLELGWDVSPLHMPVANSRNKIYAFPQLDEKTFKGLPGMIADVLPDDFGNQLINQWLILNDIPESNFTPLDRLCYIGTRGMGALEFEPSRMIGTKQVEEIDIDKLVDLAGRVLDTRSQLSLSLDETEGLNELIKVGTSAGGQRAKAVIAYNQKTGEIRSGQAHVPEGFEHYLIKFDGVTNESLGDPLGYGRIEYAYSLMAKDCGIRMEDCHLLEENNRAHFMTKRFDRSGQNKKIHMQTLCALAHFNFNVPGMYSYEDAFDCMRQLKLSHDDAIQLFRRMVFNIIARNQDDHTKNISFLMDTKGKWSLSPAYDVTYAYNPQGIWTSQHQMAVRGKRDGFTREDLLNVAEFIHYRQGKEDIDRISTTVSNWKFYAKEAGVTSTQLQAIQKVFRLY